MFSSYATVWKLHLFGQAMATQYSHSEQSLYPRHRPGVVSYLKLDVEKNKSGYYKKLYLYQSKKDFLNNCQANTSYCQTHKPLQEADGIYITDSQTWRRGIFESN